VTGYLSFSIDETGTQRESEFATADGDSPALIEARKPARLPKAGPPAHQPSTGIGATVWRWLGYQEPGVMAIGIARTVVAAQVAYCAAKGHYAQAISELLAPAANPPYLVSDNKKLTWPMVGGCRFTLLPVTNPATFFALLVEPVGEGSGERWLYADQSGIIRWSAMPDIGPDSPPL